MRFYNVSLLCFMAFSAAACSQGMAALDERTDLSETELNAPEGEQPLEEPDPAALDKNQVYYFPKWNSSFGISETIFNRAQAYYDQNWKNFENRRYVVIIDMGLHSSKRRFVLFDLKDGTAQKYLTSHGKGSDPDGNGYVNSFSNVEGSNQTSLGFYKTDEVYNGKHGRSIRLLGLSSTNSNAYARAIVVHGASYVSEVSNSAGRSLGCPALDNQIVQATIDKIRGGSMMLIATSRAL